MAEDRPTTPHSDQGDGIDASSTEELVELRRLLLGPQQSDLTQLRWRLDDPLMRAQETSDVLAHSINLAASENRAKMSTALLPAVEDAIQTSVRRNPRVLADAVYPIIGQAIRKALTALLGSMLQSLNQALEHSFSWKGLKFRWEAFRTRKSFGEVVLLRTLVYRVEEIFLIHRKTGLLLQHVAIPSIAAHDTDVVSGMLTAIQDFCRHAFSLPEGDSLETMQVGPLQVWIEPGPEAFLAAVIRGTPPRDLQPVLQQALESIHLDLQQELISFDGESLPFEAARTALESCLQTKLAESEQRKSAVTWLIPAVVIVLLGIWLGFYLRDRWHWRGYLDRLEHEPGIVVTESGARNGKYFVAGLRDPLARDPAVLLAETRLSRDDVVSRWDPYYSAIPEFMLTRCRSVLQPPSSVTLRFVDGVLALSGSASHRWITEAVQLASLLPGVIRIERTSLKDDDLEEADRIRKQLESIAILFDEGSSVMNDAGQAQLRIAIQDIGRLLDLAETIVTAAPQIDIIGHTDRTGAEEANNRLGRQRADRVVGVLLDAGIKSSFLNVLGIGAAQPAAPELSEQQRALNRRVTFKVKWSHNTESSRP
jgi:outer membrane protein OmpA-like peptidoglycan-associated protein